jgi:hypothetical protein
VADLVDIHFAGLTTEEKQALHAFLLTRAVELYEILSGRERSNGEGSSTANNDPVIGHGMTNGNNITNGNHVTDLPNGIDREDNDHIGHIGLSRAVTASAMMSGAHSGPSEDNLLGPWAREGNMPVGYDSPDSLDSPDSTDSEALSPAPRLLRHASFLPPLDGRGVISPLHASPAPPPSEEPGSPTLSQIGQVLAETQHRITAGQSRLAALRITRATHMSTFTRYTYRFASAEASLHRITGEILDALLEVNAATTRHNRAVQAEHVWHMTHEGEGDDDDDELDGEAAEDEV